MTLLWEGLFDVVRNNRTSCAPAWVTWCSRRLAPQAAASSSTATDRHRSATLAQTPGPVLGHPAGGNEPAGRPADPPSGMWWLYVPLAFDDFAVVLIVQEEPDGFARSTTADLA